MTQQETTPGHLLDKGLNELHSESKNLLGRISAWRHETEKRSGNGEEAMLIGFLADAEKLHSKIDQHKHALFLLLKEEKPDEEAYRDQHKRLFGEFEALEKRFDQLKTN